MRKYDISDDGKVIDGKIVVFLGPSRYGQASGVSRGSATNQASANGAAGGGAAAGASAQGGAGPTAAQPSASGAAGGGGAAAAAGSAQGGAGPNAAQPSANGTAGGGGAAAAASAQGAAGRTAAEPAAAAPEGAQRGAPAATKKEGGAEPALKDPRWTAAELRHGEEASMEVAVERGNGRRVRFIVERKDGANWTKEAELEAAVTSGKASGKIALQHPAQKSGNVLVEAGEHEVRFRCEMI